MHVKRAIMIAAACGSLIASAIALGPTAASADPATNGGQAIAANGSVYVNGAAFRTGPHVDRTIVGRGASGDALDVHCYAYGDWVPDPRGDGNFSWYWSTNLRTGITGYVSMSMITPPNSSPEC